MLDFLLRVWNQVVALFTYVWNYIWWFYSTGYNSLSEYTNGFRTPVWSYVYWYQWSLQHYRDVAQPKSDDIVVNNYSTTRYSAVSSFGSISYYRNHLEGALGYIGTTLFNPILNFFGVDLPHLTSILGIPQGIRDYIFGKGYDVTRSYESNEKPTVIRLKPYDHNVEWANSEPRFSKAREYLDLYYLQHSDLAKREKPYVDKLVERSGSFNLMTDSARVSRAIDLLDNKYGSMITLAGLQAQVSRLAEPVAFGKINWFIDKGYDKLVETNNDTPSSILDKLATNFIDWFFTLLFNWLMEAE
jgi:hypothetical protein